MEQKFTPWAIIISALIIGVMLLISTNMIGSKLTDLKASVENIKISAPAAGNSGTTAQAQATPTPVPKPADLSFASDTKLYPFEGASDAKVTVIEFYDFQCPFCGMAYGKNYAAQYADLIGSEQKLKALATAGKIKLVYGTLAFLGDESFTAAQAALCANEQGKFVEMHDAIMDAQNAQENSGKYTKANLTIIAKKVSSLDQTAFGKCLNADTYKASLDQMNQNGFNSAGVKGTPTLFINGQQSSGSWTELKAKLSAVGVQAQ